MLYWIMERIGDAACQYNSGGGGGGGGGAHAHLVSSVYYFVGYVPRRAARAQLNCKINFSSSKISTCFEGPRTSVYVQELTYTSDFFFYVYITM